MNVLVFLCLFRCILSDIVVNTSNGPVRGASSLAETVDAFLGIPYAEPPINELRFAKPVAKSEWNFTYDASRLPPPCPQLNSGPYYFMPDITNMSEDCLYLNIWSPKRDSSSLRLKPVIIFIHPGMFITGSSTVKAHDGSNFASHGDVIVVTINYRLGALGYFLAYTEEAEGNMGMYDQIMAIKWVKENAEHFGGDPENIVLMGVSAGAFSVSAHMISPLSKNLFKGAIIQSGGIVNPLFLDNNTRLYENSESLASRVGCSNQTITLKSDPHTVMKCLRKTTIDDITKAEKELFLSNPYLFFPRVNDEFLPEGVVEPFREGKFRDDVNVLMGLTQEEGTLLMTVVLEEYFGRYGSKETSLSKPRAVALVTGMLLSMKEPNAVETTRFYLNAVKDRSVIGYSKAIANAVGDYLISCSTLFLADFLSLKGSDVYFYKFNFRSPKTPSAEWIGTTHLDEVQYIFGSPYHGNFTTEELELSRDMIEHWSSFAKTGNPNIPGHIPWLQYHYKSPLYLSFGQDDKSIRMKPSKTCEHWRNRFNADIMEN